MVPKKGVPLYLPPATQPLICDQPYQFICTMGKTEALLHMAQGFFSCSTIITQFYSFVMLPLIGWF